MDGSVSAMVAVGSVNMGMRQVDTVTHTVHQTCTLIRYSHRHMHEVPETPNKVTSVDWFTTDRNENDECHYRE